MEWNDQTKGRERLMLNKHSLLLDLTTTWMWFMPLTTRDQGRVIAILLWERQRDREREQEKEKERKIIIRITFFSAVNALVLTEWPSISLCVLCVWSVAFTYFFSQCMWGFFFPRPLITLFSPLPLPRKKASLGLTCDERGVKHTWKRENILTWWSERSWHHMSSAEKM